ncbi:hypothetical protein Y045_1638 [Burkholderia pseudomallei MSHR2451]|nr:hypothetical protein Y045_1638 [Burkholderia pseudomallei MSHR2451]KGW98667.1 hypothetical protein Y034_5936 [Burkholderia pseudomallei MSHR449]
MSPGNPSASPNTSRTASVPEIIARRCASARCTRRLKNAWSIGSFSSKLHTRSRICECGLYAARARKRPSCARTMTVAPGAGLPSTRSIAFA